MSDDEIRREIRTIWSEVLGVPDPAAGTFFELGGHSIAAFQILAKVEDRYGVALEVDELFEDPTADGFAEVVAAQTGSAPTVGTPAG
ncbi:MAG: acyl carrier protein [Micromonosporaceae bacterium]